MNFFSTKAYLLGIPVAIGLVGVGYYVYVVSPIKKANNINAVVSQTQSTELAEIQPAINKAKLLFFMNPNGQPCQIQDKLLNDNKEQIVNIADIVYIKTTNPSDEEHFYKYGIRSLPSLIILDNKGAEYKRFSPGIQNPQEIIAALKELK